VLDLAEPPALPLAQPLASSGAVIADCRGPVCDFVFVDLLHRAYPRLPIIMTTAHWTYHLDAEARRRDHLSLLRKPFDYDRLHDLLHRLSVPRT
jgi:DNA-binding NtrC family response regulator